MIEDNTLWFLAAYIVGTGFGYYMGMYRNATQMAEITIDSLIERGYLKTRRDSNGELEILRYDED
jgi:hypothetical protein